MVAPSSISSLSQVTNSVQANVVGVDIKIEGEVYEKLLSLSKHLSNWDHTEKSDQENVKEMVARAIGLLLKTEGKVITLKDRKDSSIVSLVELFK